MTAGRLRERITFSERETGSGVPDGYGNYEGQWVFRFTVAARKRYLRGGEEVLGQRLQGTQPVLLTVRSSLETRQITTDWRATDARTGEHYNIRTISPGERRDYLDILVEAGAADAEPSDG